MTKITLLNASENEATGDRLVTIQLDKIPKFAVGQIARHRSFAQNWESSRARSVKSIVESLKTDYYIPRWTANKKGMSGEYIEDELIIESLNQKWANARDFAIEQVESMIDCGDAHKQDLNRLLEPFMLVSGILTGNVKWFNHFINLRLSNEAQPVLQYIASKIDAILSEQSPTGYNALEIGQYHYPYPHLSLVGNIAKCASISYANHNKDYDESDYHRIYNRLVEHKHVSPLEHVAMATRSGQVHRLPSNDELEFQVIDLADINQFQDRFLGFLPKLSTANFTGFISHRQLLESDL
jgi:thymidylate synthase ThyX